MRTKKIIAFIAFFSVLVFFLGLNPKALSAKEKYEEKYEKTVALAKDGKVVIKNISGNIEVKTWDKAEVKINALKVSKASTLSKAKENARKVKIEINKEDNSLLIETKYSKTVCKSLNVSVHYRLMIPSHAEIKVKSVSGDVVLENIGGEVRTDTVSGDVTIRGAEKEIDCKAISGDLTLQNIRGDIDIRTVSGDIHLTDIKGSIEANSVSGDIEIKKAFEVKRVKAKSVSGSIIYHGKIKSDGEYTFNTHSGDLHIEIPSDSAFYLEVSTFSGDIKSEFDITVSGDVLSKRKIRGTVNGGGADLDISSFSGDIYLIKR